ncbi:IS66 family insertion sequence element accessory protein TnpB [Faecalibaculum rodentium]|uniref:IS66 family insertion sequence element accessory protein TnpB n=1 Tax=Faecalibaculum rodentium TaxID=1702221 RepID=UPI003C6D295D
MLYCDGSGYWLMLKRIYEGRFKWRIESSSTVTISEKQFARLIHGFSISVTHRTYG